MKSCMEEKRKTAMNRRNISVGDCLEITRVLDNGVNSQLGLPSIPYCVFTYKDPCYRDGKMPSTVMKNQEFNLNQSTFSCNDSELSRQCWRSVSVCVYIR